MKPIIPFALLGALFAVGSASANNTDPVGYVSLGDTVGVNAVPASSDSALAIPLARTTEFAGEVDSVDAGLGTITVSGTPGWTPTTEWTGTDPYCVTITSGSEEGLIGLISDNTADTLTVTVVVGDLASVAAADTLRIAKCWTLGSYFPAATPNGTQLIAFDGTAAGINLPASQIYTKTPAGWFQTLGGSGLADDAILYPGESFILRTGPTPLADFVVAGEVPTWNHRTIINKLTAPGTGQDNRLSYFSPVGEPIGDANIPADNGDQLIVFDNAASGQNKGASIILTRTPAGWFGTLGLAGNQDAYEIGGGVGYLYRRGAPAAMGDVDWSDEQGYVSTL